MGREGGGGSQKAAGDKTFLFPEEFNTKIIQHLKIPCAVVRIFFGSYRTSIL